MGVFAWFVGLVGASRKRGARSAAWDRDSLQPVLRVKRLEERRVLNADAAPVNQLVIDAGEAAGDGQADTFHVEQHADHVRVSVNGKEVATAPVGQFDSIKVQGSFDDDILIAEFKGGEQLAGLELLFDGGEGNDSLTFAGDAPAEQVNHHFGATGSNRIEVMTASGSANIAYQGVEAVHDQLTTARRSFHSSAGGQEITLDDGDAAADNLSRLTINNADDLYTDLVVTFKNSSESLVIDTSNDGDETDSLNVAGLDGQFGGDLRVVGSEDDVLTVSGSIGLGQGDADLSAGTIIVSGSLATSAADVSFEASHEVFVGAQGVVLNAGGNINVSAPTIQQNGSLYAAGGRVQLDSGDAGVTIVRGLIDVAQSDARLPAGTVHVLGGQVSLLDNAQIQAAAALGGGTVLIGGDFQGKNPAIRNAARTFVGQNVIIRADADTLGDGGKVVVWADEISYFLGHISARGAGQGGDGGFAEVSGRQALVYRGTVDLRADDGQTGTLLLDPATLTIAGGAGDGAADGNAAFEGNVTTTDGQILFADATPVTVFESEIEAQSATANIILEATQTITTSGDFTDDAVTLAAGSNLTMRTRNQAGDGAGTINLTASLDGANLLFRTQGAGTITIVGSTDGAAASNIMLGRLRSDSGAINVSTANGTVTVSGSVTTSGADVLLSSAAALAINAPVNAGAGDVRLVARGNITQSAAGTITADELGIRQQNAAAGNIVLDDNNDANQLAAFNAAAAGTITFRDVDTLAIESVAAVASFTATDGVTTNAGNVTVISADTLTISQPINAPTAVVVLTSTAGAIVDGNAVGADITALSLALRAATGIGNGDPLETAVTNLAFSNTTSGDVAVTNTGALNIALVDGLTTSTNAGAAGDITIRAESPLTLLAAVIDSGGGDITLAAEGAAAADDLTINANVTASGGNGAINLFAGDTIQIAAAATVSAAGTGAILGSAGTDFNGGAPLNGTAAGNLVMIAGSTMQSEDGSITLRAPGDAQLSVVNANSDADGAAGDAIITADFAGVGGGLSNNVGTITDANAVGADITALNAALRAATGIGSAANPLETAVTNLAFRNTTSGDVAIADIDALVITAVDGLLVSENVGGGDILLDAGGALTINQTLDSNNGDILLDAGGTLTLNQAVDAGVGDVRLVANGDITQAAAGVITADGLGVRQQNAAAGNIVLDDNNDVSELAAFNAAAAGTITFHDIDDLTVGAVGASGTFAATAGVTSNGGAINIDVDGTLTIDQPVDSNNGDILLDTGAALTLNQTVDAGAGDVRLVANGNITQAAAGVITGDELGVRQQNAVAGNIVLDDNNDVNELAAFNAAAAGAITFHDIDDLTIGAVGASGTFAATAGVTSNGGAINIDVEGTLAIDQPVDSNNGDILLDTGAALALNQAVDAGAGDVRLVANGDITQAAAGVITADELGVRQQNAVAGNIVLDDNNDVNELAAFNAAAGGSITFHDIDDLTAGAVGASSTFAATAGVTSNGGAINIDVDGTLTIDQPVDSNNGDILLDAGAALALNQAVDAGIGDVRLVANGDITQAAAGVITADELGVRQQSAAAGNIVLDDNNDVNELAAFNAAAAGAITFHDIDDLTVEAVGASGTFAATTGVMTNGGNILLDANGALTINQPVDSNNGDILLDSGAALALNQAVDAGIGDVRVVANGDITQATAGTITADELGVRQQNVAAGNIVLDDNNDVNVLAAFNAAAGGTITFHDIDDLTIGAVGASGTFAATAGVTSSGGAINIDVEGTLVIDQPVDSNNGDILLDTGGALALNLALDAGLGDVRLVANGNITQAAAGTITANELGVRQRNVAAGNIVLNDNNNVNEFAAFNAAANGTITFHDTNGLTVGAVATSGTFAATTGVMSNDGDINIDVDAGNLTIDSPVAAGGEGSVTLNADLGTVDINAQVSSGTDDITITGNAVTQDADITTGDDGTVTVTADSGDITMGGATTDTTTATGTIAYSATGDVDLTLLQSTAGANISVTAGAAPGVAGAITDNNMSAINIITTGNLNLVADTAIGTITAFGIAEVDLDLVPDSNGAGDAIEIQVGAIALAETTTAGSTIHLIQDGNLILGNNSVNVAGVNQGQAIIHTTGNLDASLAAAINLTPGDDLALISGGTLTIPAAGTGFNVGAGDLRMVGDSDVVASGGGVLTFEANRLYFRSGGASGDATLDTTVERLIAHLETNDLVVTETNDIQLNLVTTDAGSIAVTTDAGGNGDIDVGLVTAAAGTQAVTLTADDTIDTLADDAVADVAGSTIDLTARNGIGTGAAHLDVDANVILIADTSVAGADIFIDGIGNLPLGLVNAGLGSGDATLTSNVNISDANAAGTNVMAANLTATAVTGIDADTTITNLTATTSGLGNISIRESDGANLLNVAAASGDAGVSSVTGDLNAGFVSASNAATLTATAGSIHLINNDNVADVTANTINLAAAVEIGANLAHLELTAGSALNATTTNALSGIFIDSVAVDMPVGTVNAGSGTGQVRFNSVAGILDANAAGMNISADNLLFNAASGFGTGDAVETDVNAFEGVGGTGVLLLVNQDTLVVGNVDLATIGASANGAVSIETIIGNLQVAEAVQSLAATVNLDGSGDLLVNAPVNGNQNVTGLAGTNLNTTQQVTSTTGSVTLDAGVNNTIGANVNALSGGGQIIADAGVNLAVNGILTSGSNITGTAGNNVVTSQLITSTAGSVTLDAGNDVNLAANVNAVGGNIVLDAGRNDPQAITLTPGVLLVASGGQVSNATFNFNGARFIVLDNSGDLTFPPLTPAQNIAEIQVFVADPLGTNFQITIDWEAVRAVPGVVVVEPATNQLARFVFANVNGEAVFDPTNATFVFLHEYLENPQENDAQDIDVRIRITQLAGGSIQARIANTDVVDLLGQTVFTTPNQESISVDFTVDVLDLPTVVPLPPPTQPLPRTPQTPAPFIAPFQFVSQPPQRGNTTPIERSAGTVVRTEDRYYELRIVTFDENGNLIEDEAGRIRLNDPSLQAIAPFDPSKLPVLFGRLPANRYRIYLVEEGTERLILDFIIQQGQPVETPEPIILEMGDGAVEPLDEDSRSGETLDEQMPTVPVVPPQDGIAPPMDDAAWRNSIPLPGVANGAAASDVEAAEAFAEQFGEASFLSHGGMILGAAALAASMSNRREKSVDRLMEQFGRRRPFTGRRRRLNTKRERNTHLLKL